MFRMNWGVKIIVAYSVFVVFMLSLVYLCTQQHFELVSSDYYERELAYQGTIDGNKNAKALVGQVDISQTTDAVTIKLPVPELQTSSVYFYRPSNASSDFTVTGTGSTVLVSKDLLKNGIYKVKVSWQDNAKPYYDEQSLYVTK